MIPLFLGITLANWIGLATAATLGYIAGGYGGAAQWHMLAGILAAITCCAVHCIVFTYFIATAKWVQHAVEVKALDPALTRPTRSFKAQAFPAALGAIGMVFLTAVMGAVVDSYGIDRLWHHLTALAMLGVNVLAAVVEFFAIRRNGALIDVVLEQANAPGRSQPLSAA